MGELPLIAQGRALAKEGNYREAFRLFERAAKENPRDPEAAFLLGAAQFKLGDYNSARKQLKHAYDLGAGDKARELLAKIPGRPQRTPAISKRTIVGLVILLCLIPIWISVNLWSNTASERISPGYTQEIRREIRAPVRVITAAEFGRIQTGMSKQQVFDIVGKPGELMSENNIAGYHTEMYQWTNADMSAANVMLQNDKVIQKSQFGLGG